jgi:hypothetical protein
MRWNFWFVVGSLCGPQILGVPGEGLDHGRARGDRPGAMTEAVDGREHGVVTFHGAGPLNRPRQWAPAPSRVQGSRPVRSWKSESTPSDRLFSDLQRKLRIAGKPPLEQRPLWTGTATGAFRGSGGVRPICTDEHRRCPEVPARAPAAREPQTVEGKSHPLRTGKSPIRRNPEAALLRWRGARQRTPYPCPVLLWRPSPLEHSRPDTPANYAFYRLVLEEVVFCAPEFGLTKFTSSDTMNLLRLRSWRAGWGCK